MQFLALSDTYACMLSFDRVCRRSCIPVYSLPGACTTQSADILRCDRAGYPQVVELAMKNHAVEAIEVSSTDALYHIQVVIERLLHFASYRFTISYILVH